MHAYRTHTCGALTAANVGETVRLSGWIHRKRDHGGVLFVDLRDHYGITQIVADEDSPALQVLDGLRVESVVTIDGEVKARSASTVNANLPTGEIEIYARGITVQSRAEELPMPVAGEQEYPEEIRLKNRFLDLRRDKVHSNIVLRSKVISSIRRRMTDAGFTEFQTPILGASSPEGARDYLVPARMHPGRFYALPQAPQMFKQLLMVAGFDRYFQIAPCFRDEDLRADRSPEFYQLDFEMSYVTQEDVFQTLEPVLAGVFEEFSGGKTVTPAGTFPRIPYADALLKYGSDKPDLRNPLIISDVTSHFEQSGFGLFEKMLDALREDITQILLTRELRVAPPPQRSLPDLPDFLTGHIDPLTGIDDSNDGDGSERNAAMFGSLAGSPRANAGPGNTSENPWEGQEISRNAPCPCGSGNKYKHCHGAAAAMRGTAV